MFRVRTALIVFTLACVAAALWGQARAAGTDAQADRVLGQSSFTSYTQNQGGVSAQSLSRPARLAVGPGGGLFIADATNNRVLRWASAAAFANHAPADLVLGQPNFTSNGVNQGATTNANTLYNPQGVAVDSSGNIYVADTFNHRVLVYQRPLSNGMAATRIIGQPSATAATLLCSATGLARPTGVTLDAANNLYVADQYNDRVLLFLNPLDSNATAAVTADRVWGQAAFSPCPDPANVTAATMREPSATAVDAAGNLFVADTNFHRVLLFRDAQGSDLAAATAPDRVWGASNYTGGDPNEFGANALSLLSPGSLTLLSDGALVVADEGHNRIVGYRNPLGDDLAAARTADLLLGQPSFLSENVGGGDVGMREPRGVVRDATDNVYVSDTLNNRLLAFDQPFVNPVPALSPPAIASARLGSSPPRLSINGTGFRSESIVQVNGVTRATTVVSSTQLLLSLTDADLAQPGELLATISNPAPGGGTSAALKIFEVYTPAAGDFLVDRVLGQLNAYSAVSSNPPTDASFNEPRSVAVAPDGRLWVADFATSRMLAWPSTTSFNDGDPAEIVITSIRPIDIVFNSANVLFVSDPVNNRVLVYRPPFESGQQPSGVLGQPNLETTTADCSASKMSGPYALAIDQSGRLYVSEGGNRRVIAFNAAATSDAVADYVWGQTALTTCAPIANGGILRRDGINSPIGVAISPQGALAVSDSLLSRVLIFNDALNVDLAAARDPDQVLGQPNFTSFTPSGGSNGLNSPTGIMWGANEQLFVADTANNRVLIYTTPRTAPAANRVIGQPDFAQTAPQAVSRITIGSPYDLAFDAARNLVVADGRHRRVVIFDNPFAPPPPPTATPTATALPTAIPSPTTTAVPTSTLAPGVTPSATAIPSATATLAPGVTPTRTTTPVPTPSSNTNRVYLPFVRR